MRNSSSMICGPEIPPARPLSADFSVNAFLGCHQSNKVPCPPARRGNQEQTQIIATAIGKPKANATAIVDVNAESKLVSGCTLSSSGMIPLHGLEGKSRHRDKAVTASRSHPRVQ